MKPTIILLLLTALASTVLKSQSIGDTNLLSRDSGAFFGNSSGSPSNILGVPTAIDSSVAEFHFADGDPIQALYIPYFRGALRLLRFYEQTEANGHDAINVEIGYSSSVPYSTNSSNYTMIGSFDLVYGSSSSILSEPNFADITVDIPSNAATLFLKVISRQSGLGAGFAEIQGFALSPIPEPSTYAALLGFGVFIVAVMHRNRNARSRTRR
jgi:hypothetical protein